MKKNRTLVLTPILVYKNDNDSLELVILWFLLVQVRIEDKVIILVEWNGLRHNREIRVELV